MEHFQAVFPRGMPPQFFNFPPHFPMFLDASHPAFTFSGFPPFLPNDGLLKLTSDAISMDNVKTNETQGVLHHIDGGSSAPSPTSGGPVTPPLTPLDGTIQPTKPPTRCSSRTRRPPIFIEGESTCPICGIILRARELPQHYQQELSLLNDPAHRLTASSRKRKRELRPSRGEVTTRPAPASRDARRNVLTRVRHNRQLRGLTAPISIEKAAPSTSTHTPPAAVSPTATTSGLTTAACPVCDEVIDAALVSAHVEACLNSKEGSTSADGSDEEYETYTWCGQTRVRATTLMGSDSLAASGFEKITNQEADEDVLVVDDEAEGQYGAAQYSEADVIPCSNEENEENLDALRSAVVSNSEKKSVGTPSDKWKDDSVASIDNTPFRCLICMDRYSKPLVSVQCWHVHCEECWLRTLGAKKLCPQCNLITSPNDLRKIYL